MSWPSPEYTLCCHCQRKCPGQDGLQVCLSGASPVVLNVTVLMYSSRTGSSSSRWIQLVKQPTHTFMLPALFLLIFISYSFLCCLLRYELLYWRLTSTNIDFLGWLPNSILWSCEYFSDPFLLLVPSLLSVLPIIQNTVSHDKGSGKSSHQTRRPPHWIFFLFTRRPSLPERY